MLRSGDAAPPINTTDIFGKPVQLERMSRRFVLLAFLRYAGCPWCNLAIHRLALEHPMLKREGCDVIAFVQSGKQQIQTNIYDRHKVVPEFPVVPDSARVFYERYGVQSSKAAVLSSVLKVPFWLQAAFKHGFHQTEVDGDLFLVPALFLVDTKTNQIVYSRYSSSFYEHTTFTEIYEHLTFEKV
ncbi:MAG TPA: redoxin domain-containing protein [Candidatus Limnocylindrales bacterium]|nr:redoxin domain-containing protein [Candidatus Limnocylindrales bacterium]